MTPLIKNDSSITYNHMEGEELLPALKRTKRRLLIRFIVEESIIALLLALIFYMI
jgi:hypothetical protein